MSEHTAAARGATAEVSIVVADPPAVSETTSLPIKEDDSEALLDHLAVASYQVDGFDSVAKVSLKG